MDTPNGIRKRVLKRGKHFYFEQDHFHRVKTKFRIWEINKSCSYEINKAPLESRGVVIYSGQYYSGYVNN